MDEASEAPATLEIDYPEHERDRLTAFLRPVMVLPIFVILALVSGGASRNQAGQCVAAAGGIVFLPAALMLLFRRKYPRWWFDWNLELTRFSARVWAYLTLLRDEYPSTDEEQAVHIDIVYPDASTLSPWMPLVKWALAIPHYLVLACLTIAAGVGVIIGWFAILFTGRYPLGIFEFVVGVFRWWLRVGAYAFLLTTDRYPPFRLSAP
ncbi:MAG TPA: DUF4389 domain-containing protein [Gemmatimonadales bacterium]